MTNAIEQTKRDMYRNLKLLSELPADMWMITRRVNFEESVEAHLEALRQDHENLKRRLSSMTEERDAIQLRLHAVDHAYRTQQEEAATITQRPEENASGATTDANAAIIHEAVESIQEIVYEWGVANLKAKKAMLKIARVVNGEPCYSTMRQLEIMSTECMHSFHQCYGPRETCTYCGVAK